MSEHFQLGALEKETGHYVYPLIARKGIQYACPSCERDVTFKLGKIKKPHFAHKPSQNPCFYYDRPNESEIHKEAKLVLDRVLKDRRPFEILRECKHCFTGNAMKVMFSSETFENTESKIEYRFVFEEKIKVADVALLKDNNLFAVFEVLYSHATLEGDRPEPWFEFKGLEIIQDCNKRSETLLQLRCVRQHKCDMCDQREKEEERRHLLHLKEMEEIRRKEAERQENKKKEEMRRKEEERLKQMRDKLSPLEKLALQYSSNETEYGLLFGQLTDTFREKYDEAVEKSNLELRAKMQGNECACGLMILNMCQCQSPKYEHHRFTGNMVCAHCKKWKCRC